MGNKQTRQKKILDSERFHKTDIAFSGAGFLGMYYVGATYCIYLFAPDLLQQRIGGTSAGEPIKNYRQVLTFLAQVHFRVCS